MDLLIKNKEKPISHDFFNEFFNTPFFRGDSSCMLTDIKEQEDQYLIDIEIPGFSKDEIKISFEDGYLTVEAIKDEKNSEEKFIYRERLLEFKRSYYVGNINEENINANLNNGVLSIQIKKEKNGNKKYITIE